MRTPYASIIALLVSVFGVLAGNGLMTTLLPVRAELSGFTAADIGFMGSAYFAGMLAGAWITPWVVRRFGHIQAFGLSAFLGAIGIVIMGLHVEPVAWIVMRGVCGFLLAGIYAIVESWLQGKADNRVRGRIIGVYSVVQYGGWAFGNQFMRLAEPTSFFLFGLAALVITVFLLPLLAIREPRAQITPTAAGRGGLNLLWLYREAPVGVVAVTLIGACNGPFWSLTPVFATSIGLKAVAVATLMSVITVGAALFQFPVGRLSDRSDRRLVLVMMTLANALLDIGLFVFGSGMAGWPLLVTGFLMGGILSTQYYIASAHTNDRTGPENVVVVASGLLFLYCVGAIIGPVTASLMMEKFGASALYLHNAGIHVAIAVFVMLRMLRRPPPFKQPAPI